MELFARKQVVLYSYENTSPRQMEHEQVTIRHLRWEQGRWQYLVRQANGCLFAVHPVPVSHRGDALATQSRSVQHTHADIVMTQPDISSLQKLHSAAKRC